MEALTDPWRDVLARPDARRGGRRPDLVRAGVRLPRPRRLPVFTERVDWMLRDDGPEFPNWDQDAAAVAARYHEQDPGAVAEVRDAAADVRDAFAAVEGEQWQRTGVRSDGSEFTVETLGQYFLHDLAHHLVDVGA